MRKRRLPIRSERGWIDADGGLDEPLGDGDSDAWMEPGSDELMDFEKLVRVRSIATSVEVERDRKIRRRAE